MQLVFAFLLIFTLALAKAQQARDVTVRQATEEDPTSVSSSASPASPLIFHPVDQMTTCQSGNISWDYGEQALAQLTLKITDANVNQSDITSPPPIITQTLESDIDARVGSWIWLQVNVSSGYYIVEGFVNDSSFQTEPFFIANGSDTSCISSLLPSNTAIPSSTSSPRKLKVGAIVGGAVGGAVIIAAILTLLFIRKFNRPRHSTRRAGNVRWAKFPSTDSQDPFGRVNFSGSKSSGQLGSSDERRSTESIGSKLDVVTPAASTDPFGDEKDASPSSTKSSTLASVIPLSYDNGQISTSSHPPNYSRPRVPSTRNSARNSANALPFDVLPDSRQHYSLDILDPRVERPPSLPNMPPATYYSHEESSEMIPLGRSSSSRSTGNRRASRKPVPRYDPSELEIQLGATNKVDVPPFNPESEPVSSLNHKLSFGDVRAVHYLIPDMPPPHKT